MTLLLGRVDSNETRTLTFVRRPVTRHSVHEVAVKTDSDGSPRISMVRIDSITASTARELRSWENKLRSSEVRAVILDFRYARFGRTRKLSCGRSLCG